MLCSPAIPFTSIALVYGVALDNLIQLNLLTDEGIRFIAGKY